MSRIAGWLSDAEAKLDEWGKGAWITVMVLGFVFFWPVGLLILGYMIWSGRMGCSPKRSKWRKAFGGKVASSGTGNTVFDDYREQTLRRLEEEQSAFEGFLGRLRQAKDKAEFDQFMAERRNDEQGPATAS